MKLKSNPIIENPLGQHSENHDSPMESDIKCEVNLK